MKEKSEKKTNKLEREEEEEEVTIVARSRGETKERKKKTEIGLLEKDKLRTNMQSNGGKREDLKK